MGKRPPAGSARGGDRNRISDRGEEFFRGVGFYEVAISGGFF
jgi:hypothetical protein